MTSEFPRSDASVSAAPTACPAAGLPPEDSRSDDTQLDDNPTRLRRGEDHAARALSDAYGPAMLRFCWGYLGQLSDAEDAVQDVLCKALAAPRRAENLRAWLYKVARNHCLNLLRGRRRRRDGGPLPSASRLPAGLTGPLTGLARGEQRSRLRHMVAALPAAYREVLMLRYAEGLTRGEIAEVLDAPETTVKNRLFEGLRRLRAHAGLLEE
jgi:RNA polymerase sigma-70 factor (ECF subfamily)